MKRQVFAVAGIGVALVVVVVAAMAIGGSGRPNAAPAGRSGTPTGRVPVFVAATRPAPEDTPAPAPAATPSPRRTRCSPVDLAIAVEGWTVSYGARIMSVALRNTGARPCSVHTTYRVALLDAGGGQVAVSGSSDLDDRVQRIPVGDAVSGLVDWSSWCGRGPAAPVALALLDPEGEPAGAAAELPDGFAFPACAGDRATLVLPFVEVLRYVGPPQFFYQIAYASLSADKRRLTVAFQSESQCPDYYEASVLVRGDELLVGILPAKDREPPPGHPDRCRFGGVELEVRLAAPFGGSTLRDRGSVDLHYVRPPKSLVELTGLPDRWRLRAEGGRVAGPGAWGRVFSPLARPPAFGRRLVTLVQTFGAPPSSEPGHDARRVTINGAPGTLARAPGAGDLQLIWRLGGDELTLSAHESDFSEAELIELAESAVAARP